MKNSEIGSNLRSLTTAFDKAANFVKKSPSVLVTEGYLALIFAKRASKSVEVLLKGLNIKSDTPLRPIELLEKIADQAESRSLRVNELRGCISHVKAIEKECKASGANNAQAIKVAKKYLIKLDK